MIAWLCSFGVAGAALQADRVFYELSAQLQAVNTNAPNVDGIVRVARQAGDDYGKTLPIVAARIYRDAAHAISFFYQTNRSVLPAYWEMATRQREYLDALPFAERLQALNRSIIPLGTPVKLGAGPDGSIIRGAELELLLKTWIELEAENGKIKDWSYEDGGGFMQRQSNPNDSAAELRRQEANARWKAVTERNNHRQMLWANGQFFTNRVIAHIAQEYGKTPHLVAQLQEVMDSYLPPPASTNVMNKVFEAMKPAVAAKTPRPVPGAKGERWLRAPPPAPEPQLPAIARPSKLRERLAAQAQAGMVAAGGAGGVPVAGSEVGASAAGAAGGTSGWVWAALGLVVLAGGWVWLRLRS